MDEYQLQQILKSVTRLTNFKYIAAPWGSESFNALSQHFETLVKLHLGNNVSFTSVMVHTVMSSCPNLKELTSREIKGLDIVHDNRINKDTRPDQGWICTRLRILAISLDLDGIDSQIPILERISSLTQLQKLNLRSNGETIFKLSLDCGLDILKPLKNLLEVEAWQSGANMTEEDIQWVFENWRKLKSTEMFVPNFEHQWCTPK
ncbi:hypothetical protein BGZ76_005828 [Entomortierella beljakovae]|nr:hypothetical protein BGZ76_005828 [Entomortierella beljakovae]